VGAFYLVELPVVDFRWEELSVNGLSLGIMICGCILNLCVGVSLNGIICGWIIYGCIICE